MSISVEGAIKKLERSLTLLERAVTAKLETEKRKSDIELELQLMQDDRVKLAEELEGTTEQLGRIEFIVEDVGGRVEKAIDTIENVLANSNETDNKNDR